MIVSIGEYWLLDHNLILSHVKVWMESLSSIFTIESITRILFHSSISSKVILWRHGSFIFSLLATFHWDHFTLLLGLFCGFHCKKPFLTCHTVESLSELKWAVLFAALNSRIHHSLWKLLNYIFLLAVLSLRQIHTNDYQSFWTCPGFFFGTGKV